MDMPQYRRVPATWSDAPALIADAQYALSTGQENVDLPDPLGSPLTGPIVPALRFHGALLGLAFESQDPAARDLEGAVRTAVWVELRRRYGPCEWGEVLRDVATVVAAPPDALTDGEYARLVGLLLRSGVVYGRRERKYLLELDPFGEGIEALCLYPIDYVRAARSGRRLDRALIRRLGPELDTPRFTRTITCAPQRLARVRQIDQAFDGSLVGLTWLDLNLAAL